MAASERFPLLVLKLRRMLRDRPEVNTLQESGEELETEDLKLALVLALDDFNNTPFITRFTFASFPYVGLLLDGAFLQALKMAAVGQARNELNYSAGGVQVRTSDKAPMYMQIFQTLLPLYEQRKRDFKRQLNLQGGYASLPSEYFFLAFGRT